MQNGLERKKGGDQDDQHIKKYTRRLIKDIQQRARVQDIKQNQNTHKDHEETM
jgi:hypothetical protein